MKSWQVTSQQNEPIALILPKWEKIFTHYRWSADHGKPRKWCKHFPPLTTMIRLFPHVDSVHRNGYFSVQRLLMSSLHGLHRAGWHLLSMAVDFCLSVAPIFSSRAPKHHLDPWASSLITDSPCFMSLLSANSLFSSYWLYHTYQYCTNTPSYYLRMWSRPSLFVKLFSPSVTVHGSHYSH